MTDLSKLAQETADKFADQVLSYPSELKEWREVGWATPEREKVVEWFRERILSALNLAVAGAYIAAAQQCGTHSVRTLQYVPLDLQDAILNLTSADAAQALAEHDEHVKAQGRLEERERCASILKFHGHHGMANAIRETLP